MNAFPKIYSYEADHCSMDIKDYVATVHLSSPYILSTVAQHLWVMLWNVHKIYNQDLGISVYISHYGNSNTQAERCGLRD